MILIHHLHTSFEIGSILGKNIILANLDNIEHHFEDIKTVIRACQALEKLNNIVTDASHYSALISSVQPASIVHQENIDQTQVYQQIHQVSLRLYYESQKPWATCSKCQKSLKFAKEKIEEIVEQLTCLKLPEDIQDWCETWIPMLSTLINSLQPKCGITTNN